MKKTVSLLLAILLCLTFVGCGNAATSSPSSSEPAKEDLLASARRDIDDGNYAQAILFLELITSDSPVYGRAREMLKEAQNKYIDEAIENIESLSANGKHTEALQAVIEARDFVPAVQFLTLYDRELGLYGKSVVDEAKAIYEKDGFAAAKVILDAALEKFPEEKALLDELTKFKKECSDFLVKDIPCHTNSKNVIFGEGGVTDTVGDTYGEKSSIMVTSSSSAKLNFDLGGKYTTLCGTLLLPKECADAASASSVTITINGNDNVFTKNNITSNFETVYFEVDITGARELSIRIKNGSVEVHPNTPCLVDLCVLNEK